MTSAFTRSEVALAELGMAALSDGAARDVVVGGLGLGYTARAVLAAANVASLIVVEFLPPVIKWHRNGIVPLGPELFGDGRLRFVEGDFFAMAASPEGLDPDAPGRRFDAILADLDHSPAALLDDRSESFYRPDGLRAVGRHLKPGGIFGLWSESGLTNASSSGCSPRFLTRGQSRSRSITHCRTASSRRPSTSREPNVATLRERRLPSPPGDGA